jgi:homoserine kinase type II
VPERAGAATQDHRLAIEFAREWAPNASLRPLDAMNSSTWEVVGAPERFVLKIADPGNEAGLRVAICLEERGIETGAPQHIAERNGRLVALLRFVDGRPLAVADAARVGSTLGAVHRVLVDCDPPPTLDRWPWPWLDTSLISEPGLRAAATAAIDRANELAPSVTHGILHGDPAPEAFLATATGTALIDWGSSCHGPLLFDVASAVMYAGADVIRAYGDSGRLGAAELATVDVFLRFRWALQAWYFSKRLESGDLTGIEDESNNQKGLDDAKAGLGG